MNNVPADKTSSNNKTEALEYTARASETDSSVKTTISDAEDCLPRAF